MSNLKSLAKETAIYGLSSIAARFIGYLLVPIETAKFNAAGGQYGIITNIYAYIALLIIILTYGMETTFFRFMNRPGEDPKKVYATTLRMVATTSLVFILLLWVIVIAALIVGFGGSLSKAVTKLWDDVPSFFSYPGPDGWVPYASRFGYPFSCAIGWTIMLPHVFVRSGYFGDDLKAQRRLSYMTPVLQGIVWTGTMLIGLIGLALVQGLPTSETELIIPYIVKNFVVSFNPVLAKILMVAFFIGASAVGLSTSNAFLSVASAIVADDLLRNTFHMDLSGKKGVNANRIIIAVLGIGSMLLALDPPELIFTLIMFSIAIVMPLFPVLVLGIYWKKATKQAAIVSSIVGTVLVLMTYFVWNIGGTWYGAIGMLGSTVCMVAVSLFTKQDSKDSEAFFAALKNGMNRSYKIEDKAVAAQAGMSTED